MVFCGHNVMYHHTITCFNMMLKAILVRSIDVSQIRTLKFEFLHEFSENFKRNWQGMVSNIICHVTMHPCAKFEVI